MPRRALTAASVQRIKPPKKGQLEIFDAGYPGLSLRVSYAGSRSFNFFYRHNGKLSRMVLGHFPSMSLAEARDAWRAAREEVANGRNPSIKRDKAATDFEAVAREWLKRDQSKNRSYADVVRTVERELIPAWGSRAITDMGRRDVLDLIDGIADRGKVIMARRVLAAVHRLFRWAVGRGIVTTNPAADLPKPGAETKRDRVLTDKELKAVWRGAGNLGWPWGAALQLLILIGARREEIGQLRWSEIHGDKIVLDGKRTKNNEPHTIHLSDPAKAIIAEMPRIAGDEDYVFTTTGRSPISGWSKVKGDLDVAIKIAPWRIHDLRRTVSTNLNESGVDPHIVEAILGHTIKGVAGVYNKAKYEAQKRATLDAWGKHVESLTK